MVELRILAQLVPSQDDPALDEAHEAVAPLGDHRRILIKLAEPGKERCFTHVSTCAAQVGLNADPHDDQVQPPLPPDADAASKALCLCQTIPRPTRDTPARSANQLYAFRT